jgi:hypothetical protein
MSVIYRVQAKQKPKFSDELHYSKFFPDKLRHHTKVMNDRQDLILYLANLHQNAVKTGMPLGMSKIELRLTSLRDWCLDYRVVLDHFFDVKQLGFHIPGVSTEISTLIPKDIKESKNVEFVKASTNLKYVPPPLPDSGYVSKVYVNQKDSKDILTRLGTSGRLDLYTVVQFILEHSELNFYFERSGKLQMRDTSVWPIKGIETWPSWLRESLFGTGIDIDSAYTQFVIGHLKDAYKNQPSLLKILFPDLLRSLDDKVRWREQICSDVLGLEINEKNIGTVKKLCMSLANGSRISPSILTGSRSFSVTADLVFESTSDVSLENLNRIGKRLQAISDQYKHARKVICLWVLGTNPSRKNQKKVFESYFGWEREARYLIWESCGRHGVMVHDGIDGIPKEYLQDLPKLMEELHLKLSI